MFYARREVVMKKWFTSPANRQQDRTDYIQDQTFSPLHSGHSDGGRTIPLTHLLPARLFEYLVAKQYNLKEKVTHAQETNILYIIVSNEFE